ncbi:MAG: threonine synthase [Desulfobacteraceae bacterium 4484_190.3]|nr:MAG: threonine synthase [Desulfobacteraceae bacterium 4484_190.3]
MRIDQFPKDMQPYLIPQPRGNMFYRCLKCGAEFDVRELLYTCVKCGGVLLLENRDVSHREIPGNIWRKIFDYRRMLNVQPLKGIFRYYEFTAPIIPLDQIVYLGEGHTPVVRANNRLRSMVGMDFYYKNDGLNPSASFKDRGMACALSYLQYLAGEKGLSDILAICASTGDTSASAALYSAYLRDIVKSAVLLPQGKVTPQQLSQPLGSGARVLEMPGVFDDCMKVVELLAERYNVALLNSKNSWRILGQESFSFEVAQDFDYSVEDKVVVLPIGNAGNITAVMSGFLKFFEADVIDALPWIIGVQSDHADPVYRYYREETPGDRHFIPVDVRPSVAQAAMIGNPVSMPRVIELAEKYNGLAGGKRIHIVQVTEQEIMDSMIMANQNGNIACTQGGESLAGLQKAFNEGVVDSKMIGVLDSTAHMLKFATFQEKYFEDSFEPDFEVIPDPTLRNAPVELSVDNRGPSPQPGKPLKGKEMDQFVTHMAGKIASILNLTKK